MRTIIETTDGKYLGVNILPASTSFIFHDFTFTPTKVEKLSNGYTRYSTTSYVITTKEND